MSQWQLLWNFCNADGDSEIPLENARKCAVAAAKYAARWEAAHLSLDNVGHLYYFVVRYGDAVDQDGSDGVNYDEYIYNIWGADAVIKLITY